MGNFFRSEGPFFRYGTLLADIFVLTILWLLCSIPIITIGASTASLYYVTTRQISEREGYISSDFFKSFKRNFLQSTIVTIIFLLCAVILYINIKNMSIMGNLKTFFMTLQIIIAVELTITSIYIFPVMSRFDMKLKDLFKTAFFMANRHIFTTITCLALIIVTFILCSYIYPFFIIVGAGAYAYITSFMFMRIFKKYRSDIDVDLDENNSISN